MSAISLKSITGITSITTPAGVDDQLTLHNNNTTEAVKLDVAGNLHFHNHLNITGVSTASNFKTGTSNLHNTGLNVQDLDVDGHTNLDNVSIAGVTTIRNAGGTKLYEGSGNGSKLFHAGTERLSTETYGIDINGELQCDTLDVDGNGDISGNLVLGGDLDVDGHTNLDNISVAGVSTFTGNIKQTAPGTNTAKITLNNASDTTGMDVGYSESSGVGFINVGQSGSGLSIKTGGTAAGNERLRITSGGDVGINVTPISGVTLQVGTPNTSTGVMRGHPDYFSIDSGSSAGGGVVGTESNPALIFGGDGNTGLYHSASDILNFTTGGTERLRITTDKVMFSVDAKVDSNNQRDLGTSGNRWKSLFLGTQLEIDAASSTEMIRLDVAGTNFARIGHNSSSGVAVLDVRSEGHTRFLTGGNNERLRITSDGQIQKRQDPVNRTSLKTYSGEGLWFDHYQLQDSGTYRRYADIASVGDGSWGSILRFHTMPDSGSPTERLRITSSGNVGINQNNPTVKLQITDTSATILRTEATANDGDALIQAKGKDSSGNDRMIQMRTDAGADQYRIISSDTSYNLALCTGNAPRVLIAGNSAATSIGGANTFNAMLTTQGDISGGLLMLKATENTNRFFVTGNNTSGCEVNLYDDAGGQRGILGVSSGSNEFFIKSPNSSSQLKLYTNDGYGTVWRAQLTKHGIFRAHGFSRSSGTNSQGYNNLRNGYQGDDLTLGPSALYYVGHKNSSSSSNYSAHEVTMYTSGHWGQYTQLIIYAKQHYYHTGYRVWHVDNGGGITLKEDYGGGNMNNTNVTSGGQVTVGSGTHGGQNVYKHELTFTNNGTYVQTKWFVGWIGSGGGGHIGNSKTVAQADAHFSTQGGGLHFVNVAHESLQASAYYQY